MILVIVAMFGLQQPSYAQTTSPSSSEAEQQNAIPTQPALIAPYDDKLLRLSEILGAIHFLRELCQADEGMKWRDKMVALIEAEEPRPARRARLIARFNRGYGAFGHTYKTCTQAALVAIRLYMQEGVRLSSQIITRYGR